MIAVERDKLIRWNFGTEITKSNKEFWILVGD